VDFSDWINILGTVAGCVAVLMLVINKILGHFMNKPKPGARRVRANRKRYR
jgi:hypothetical protein